MAAGPGPSHEFLQVEDSIIRVIFQLLGVAQHSCERTPTIKDILE